MGKRYFVYILVNKLHTVFYTGMSGNFSKRICQHKHALVEGFTKRYNVKKLVYYDSFPDPLEAVVAEKKTKKYKRDWKINLIKEMNPEFKDLSDEVINSDCE